MNQSRYIWVNGQLLSWNSSNTHVLTHGLHYGSAVFEGIRAYSTPKGPAIFKANDHFQRLMESCQAYYLTCPYSVSDLIDITIQLILKNNLPSCYIRPIVYTNYGSMGIIPSNTSYTTAIAAWEWGSYLGDEGLEKGIRCFVSDIIKTPSKAMPSTAKSSANYANSFLAKKQALNAGFDEAILLNQQQHVSEGPGENIFCIKDEQIFTPPISDDILKGITRDTIIELAKALSYSVIETSLTVNDLLSADECFFTGTAAEVTPIQSINDHLIGHGTRGAITHRLQSLYFDIVKGNNPTYSHWLTFCKE